MKVVFDKLYDNYHQDLYQFIFYMVKNKHVAEDLVQDVYLKVLKSMDSFKGDSSEKTWLFSIARHTTIDYFRSQKSMRNRIAAFFDWQEKEQGVRDLQPLPEEIAIQNDELNAIYKWIDKCTLDQKSVLILRFIQQFSIQETAQILNFSISKVKTTQHRGLRKLRRLLAENQQAGGDAS